MTDQKKGRHPGGRPTDYKQEYCDEIIKHMGAGKPAVAFCADKDISESTFFLWVKTYPEFSKCYKIGKTKLKKYFMDLGSIYMIESKESGRINTSMFNKIMKLNFGRDYEKASIDTTQLIDFDGTPLEKMSKISKALKDGLISPETYKTLMDGIKIESEIIYNESIAPMLENEQVKCEE